jgi:hypothetical protein
MWKSCSWPRHQRHRQRLARKSPRNPKLQGDISTYQDDKPHYFLKYYITAFVYTFRTCSPQQWFTVLGQNQPHGSTRKRPWTVPIRLLLQIQTWESNKCERLKWHATSPSSRQLTITNSHRFSYGVHRQLRTAHVNRTNPRCSREKGTNCTSTSTILPDHEFLNWW